MKQRDAELSKIAADRERAERKRLIEEIKQLLRRVPASVINGSYQTALAFKSAAAKGHKLVTGQRISTKDAQECAAELKRFFDSKTP